MANYTGDYILYNADGSVFATNFTQIINKGSNNVNKIFVGLTENSSIDLSTYNIFAIFKLPNGTSQPVTGTSGSESIDNMGLWYGFTISIPQQVTAFAGLVKCSIYVEKNDEVLYTYPVTLTINDTSIAPDDLTFINLTQYKNMKEYIDEQIELTNDLFTETIEEKKGTKLYAHNLVVTVQNDEYDFYIISTSKWTIDNYDDLLTAINEEALLVQEAYDDLFVVLIAWVDLHDFYFGGFYNDGNGYLVRTIDKSTMVCNDTVTEIESED